jgi:hypothetical protein
MKPISALNLVDEGTKNKNSFYSKKKIFKAKKRLSKTVVVNH